MTIAIRHAHLASRRDTVTSAQDGRPVCAPSPHLAAPPRSRTLHTSSIVVNSGAFVEPSSTFCLTQVLQQMSACRRPVVMQSAPRPLQ